MKVFAVIAGIVLCLVLYFFVGYLIFPYVDRYLHDSADSLGLLLSVAVYTPIIFFLGSILTGILIEPEMEEQSYLALVFYSPGFYFVLLAGVLFVTSVFMDSVNSFFVNNPSSPPPASGVFWGRFWGCIILLVWLTASWAGVALGYKIRAKISGDD